MKAMLPELYATISVLLKSADLEPGHKQRILTVCRNGSSDQKKPAKAITTKAASEILGCCRRTVLRYGQRGVLTPIRRSKRCLRWRLDQTESLATGNEQQ